METFPLPPAIETLVRARNALKAHYTDVLRRADCDTDLRFTLDGNLVGDLGEAIAVELFGIRLVNAKSMEGIDGHTQSGKTVQIKATGTNRGPAFRNTETRADYLLFFDLNFETALGTIVYNGPEHYAASRLPKTFTGQRMLTPKQIRDAAQEIKPEERLIRL